MPKITQVEPQKKNPKRFNIFLDGQFVFGADEDLVVDHRLVAGKIIEDSELQKIIFDAEVGKLMERMYALFNIRQRSEKEVRDYLKNLSFKRKIRTRFASRSKKSIAFTRGTLPFAPQNVKGNEEGISDLVINAVIETLKRKRLLNDQEFVRSWIESRRKNKKKSDRALKAELFQKGIDKELIEEALIEGGDEESQKKLAEQALEKKLKIWQSLPYLEKRKKAYDFLLRRGFDYSLVKEVVEKFVEKD